MYKKHIGWVVIATDRGGRYGWKPKFDSTPKTRKEAIERFGVV